MKKPLVLVRTPIHSPKMLGKSETVAITVRLTSDQIIRLKRLEEIDQITVPRHIRMAVDDHLEEFEQKYQAEAPPAQASRPRKNPVISYR